MTNEKQKELLSLADQLYNTIVDKNKYDALKVIGKIQTIINN